MEETAVWMPLLIGSLVSFFTLGSSLGYLAAIKRVRQFELIICLAMLLVAEVAMVWGPAFALFPWSGAIIFGALVGCGATRLLVPGTRW